MELAKYKACICEGSAEEAIIDILVDNDLLIFNREEMLEERVIRCRSAKRFEERYLRKGFDEHMINLSVLEKTSEFCKTNLRMHDVKSYDFVKQYFSNPQLLVKAIKEYRRTANIPKGECSLSDLLR